MADEAYIFYLDFKTNSDTPKGGGVWEETLSWLQTKRGVTDLPLSYVIRKDTAPAELVIFNARLTIADRLMRYFPHDPATIYDDWFLLTLETTHNKMTFMMTGFSSRLDKKQ